MKGKRIFITGGAGYLGSNMVARYYANNELTIYSRDEAKHYYLKKQFPKIKCVIGDIRNYDLLKRASDGHDIGIFAASLKQIEAVDQNVEESVKIMINGALNSRRVAEENHFESACFVSSDKSRAPTTLYGAMKFIAGESFIVDADTDMNTSLPKLSSAIYGNVANSTGSIIPLMWKFIEAGKGLTLYDKDMTRFMISITEAIDLVETALKYNGFNLIPKLRSFKIADLFQIYAERFGLAYTIGKPRISEKIHEIMLAKEEIPRVTQTIDQKYYLMHYKNIYNTEQFENDEFSSRDVVMSLEELDKYLEQFNWFEGVK